MKINGEKLRIARHLAGYSTTDLAKELGVSKQSLSQYENGMDIKPDIYFKILKILNCEKDFLEIPLNDELKIKNTFFRATAKANAVDRKYQETKTTLVGQFYDFFSRYINFPKFNLPDLSNYSSIEEKAFELRKYWGLGDKPIKNMIRCLESNGIIVSTFSIPNKDNENKIDGYTQQFIIKNNNEFSDLYCVIVENDKRSLARKNFSLAHELGHIILHSNDDYMEKTKVEQTQIEKQANEFAAAFLLPKQSFYKDAKYAKQLNDFIDLKYKWYVSIGAMMLRARELHCINEQEYLRLIKNYSSRHYKKQEPLDDMFSTYKPILFKQTLEIMFNNGFTIEELKKELKDFGLSMPLEQIEEILGLDYGFFSKYDSDQDSIVINLKEYLDNRK